MLKDFETLLRNSVGRIDDPVVEAHAVFQERAAKVIIDETQAPSVVPKKRTTCLAHYLYGKPEGDIMEDGQSFSYLLEPKSYSDMRNKNLRQETEQPVEKSAFIHYLAVKLVERLRPTENIPNFFRWALGGALTGIKPYRNVFFIQAPPEAPVAQFLEFMGQLLGDFAMKVPSVAFKNLNYFKKLHNHLQGKRYIYCTDFIEGEIISEKVIRTLCDNEEVCLYSGGKIHYINLPAKIYIISSGFPKIEGDEDAVLRRIWPIVLLGKPSSNQPYKDLIDEFHKEASGILNWLLVGAKWFLEDPNLSQNKLPFQELAEVMREIWILENKKPLPVRKGQTNTKNRR